MARTPPALPLGITAAFSVAPQLAAFHFGLYYRLDAMTRGHGHLASWVVPLVCAVVGGLIGGATAVGPGLDPRPFRKAHIIQGIVTVLASWLLPRFGIYGSPSFFALITAGVGVGAALVIRPKAGQEPRLAPAPGAAPVPGAAPAAPVGSGGGGRVLLRLVQVAIVLGAIGGSGYAVWWNFTRVDRESKKLRNAMWVVYPGEETEYLVEHADDPRVTEAFWAQLERICEQAKSGSKDSNKPELEQVLRAFDRRVPEPNDLFVACATRARVRLGLEKARSWVPGWEKDARVTAELQKELVAFANVSGYDGFSDKALADDFPIVLTELEARTVEPDAKAVDALVTIAVRRKLEAAQKWASRRAGDGRVDDALARELAAQCGPTPDEKAVAAAAKLLAARGVPPTDALVKLVCDAWSLTYSPELIDLARSWGQDGARRIRAYTDAIPGLRKEPLLLLARIDPRVEDVPGILVISTTGSPFADRQGIDLDPTIAQQAPIDSRYAPNKYNEETRKALVAIGAKAKAEIAKGLDHPCRSVAWASARALAEIEPAALVDGVESRIELYNRRYPALAVARESVNHSDPHARSAARKVAGEVLPLAQGVAEGLLALESMVGLADAEGKGTDRADLCFMRGLSSTEEGLAKYCAGVLKTRLDLDRFIDTLFRYLARKEQFKMAEVDVYESALTSKGELGCPGIVRNLEKLLAAAGGNPERVFWIHKAIGLRCLARVGDERALPILDAYSKDTGGYTHVSTKTDRATGQVDKKETLVLYRTICDDAREAIQKKAK
jgi:hypothetical protein